MMPDAITAPERRPNPFQRVVAPALPEPAQDSIASLITRAVASEVPRLVKAADKIQDLVDQLEKDVTEFERNADLRAEAKDLERRLAEIKGQLGGKRPATPAAVGPRVDTKAVRRWAASHGIACPERGRIPAHVMARYEQAGQS